MGKAEDENPLPSTVLDGQGTTPSTRNSNACCLSCNQLQKLITFRCIFVSILGVAVILSAVFWLPFFQFGDHKKLDLDYQDHDIVASFMLKKPAYFLQDYILQLKDDIFDEMSFYNTKVEIISLEPSAGSNTTKVVFSVESDVTTQSLIRESFVSLITQQSYFHVTTFLFGNPFSFEVLKFRGGITASPEQNAFLMQPDQILFNFTLNFSIDQILYNFKELSRQLNRGLRLSPYENLYIKLTNLKGSTVAPPSTVQAQVLSAVGINFTKSRMKQLAQTINGSHSKNLGLNNTVFGRVKQVRLSSISQHSLGNDGSPLQSPSLSPLHPPDHHHHHHHHHNTRNHHHHHYVIAPSVSPSFSVGNGGPAIGKGSPASTPIPAPTPESSCYFGHGNKPLKHSYAAAPSEPPFFSPPSVSSQPKQTETPPPKVLQVPIKSPLPNVAYALNQPPPFKATPPDAAHQLVSPSPSPSPSACAGVLSKILGLPLLIMIIILLHL